MRDLVRYYVFYIKKEGFLLAFKYVFFYIFIEAYYSKAFKVLGLVPIYM
jgi:hypothetical protein